MDERELANSMLDIIDRSAHANAVRIVTKVRVAIGALRPFDATSLQSAFREVTRGTIADGARLLVVMTPIQCHCGACGARFEAAHTHAACPVCGQPHTENVSGDEVRLLDMECDES